MEFWIARDKLNYLALFKSRPILDKRGYWMSSLAVHSQGLGVAMTDKIGDLFDEDIFPEITFENSPQKIKIELIK